MAQHGVDASPTPSAGSGVRLFLGWPQTLDRSLKEKYSLCDVHLRRAFRAPSELPIGPRVLPEPQRDWKRIDVEPLPPCCLVT